LIAKIEQELKDRFSATDTRSGTDLDADIGADGPFDYSTALTEAFDKPGRVARTGTFPQTTAISGVVNNPELRRARVQTALSEDKDAEPPTNQRFRRVSGRVWEAKDSAVRQFLLEQYGGHCQACGETFAKRDSTPYFEGLYLVGRTYRRWLDRPGNVVCLCATCCAKFQRGIVEAPDILEQVMRWRTRQEGGRGPCITLQLCGRPIQLKFTEKHLLDLQEIVKDDF
jgi:hypothetical protein